MKKLILAIIMIVSLTGLASAEDDKALDPNKLFYSANNLYEKGAYDKALSEYNKILDIGIDSGRLYYNIGNCYFKLGKLGYAILFYDRALRIIPYDADLRANLNYALSSMSGTAIESPTKNFVISLIKTPFKDFNLNAIAIAAIVFYIIFVIFQVLLIVNPVIAKKLSIFHFVFTLIFVLSLGAFAIRYYDEEIVRRGIVVQKQPECKYEPIDKSTTFYRLHEGDEISVLSTRSGWRRVKRIDGKIGWIKQEAVEEI